ncbi:hypothetical protein XENOCAPTIV_007340 [Xenoophorus captivus]|uniref:Uncharacterized protein n=1 Tax=Xenoophorus captivus TaxID=1517983 RepID=A0ABV0Q4M0_9TELE
MKSSVYRPILMESSHSPTSCLLVLPYLCEELTNFFNELGLRINLSSRQTISSNLGRLLRSRCQQSIIRWYRASGQSIGPGNL